MVDAHDDLLPLFLEEARERVHRLASLAVAVHWDENAVAQARRELHTLKGAARMLGLAPVADLCHRTEEELLTLSPTAGRLLTQRADALAGLLDALAGESQPPLSGRGNPADQPSPGVPAGPGSMPSGLRSGSGELEVVTERAARLRLLAVAAGQLVAQLETVLRAASRAAQEPQPEQALALWLTSLKALATELEAGQRRLQRLADAQLDALLELQLQPLRPFLQELARHGRELARSLGKEVEFLVSGEETRLDRRMVRELEEALLHLVRNAVDHGAEPPARRQERGKPPTTTIRIQAQPVGRRVRLVVSDDGAGIEPRAVVQAAMRRGLLDPGQAAALDEEGALRLLFLPGLSTRERANDLSGRGVGLDAVRAAALRLGGDVTLASTPGQGTAVTVEVPVARRGEMVAVLRVAHLKFAIPARGVQECRWFHGTQVVERGGHLLAMLDGAPVPFASPARIFHLAAEPQLLVRGAVGGESFAVAVDAQEGEAEVLVRPLPRWVSAHPVPAEGLALLPSGEPVVVFSPLRLMQAAHRPPTSPSPGAHTAVRVLLVEDSWVTREMERRILEDAGFVVVTAADAAEALAHLGEKTFDCVVTDVEMPGMDGFELTRQIRKMPALAHLPIVVVSTRDRPEDRLAGLQAGADAYLTKQRLEAGELVQLVHRLGLP